MSPRTADDGLRCEVPGCRTTIHAFTGLQELQKLIQHYWRAHHARLSMTDALELRSRMEVPLEDRPSR
jgi:hypothetical protein